MIPENAIERASREDLISEVIRLRAQNKKIRRDLRLALSGIDPNIMRDAVAIFHRRAKALIASR